MSFTVKDSGARHQFDSGMVRDTQENKTLFHLLFDGPMYDRWAEHLTKGAQKYSEGNWLKAEGEAELRRFRASAARHFRQWMRGDTDEDHAAAVFFNINGHEYVKSKLKEPKPSGVAVYFDVYKTTSPESSVRWFVSEALKIVRYRAHPSEVSFDSSLTYEQFMDEVRKGRFIVEGK